jgi:AraC family transcriptional regulator, regulatory protein of adaptative response / DNA-3-methyladenine glycosylase II
VLARLVAFDGVRFDAGADSSEALDALLEIPGVGPWTASYVAMRALGDPDAFPAGDVGIKHGLRLLGGDAAAPDGWRPWRSYAVMHLWALVSAAPDGGLVTDEAEQLAERDVRVDEVQAPAGVGRGGEDRRAA